MTEEMSEELDATRLVCIGGGKAKREWTRMGTVI